MKEIKITSVLYNNGKLEAINPKVPLVSSPEKVLLLVNPERSASHQRKIERTMSHDISRGSDINRVVHNLRTEVYASYFGYMPLLYDENLPLLAEEGVRRQILTPEDIPFAVFKHDVREYSGSLDNYRVELVPPNITSARIVHSFIDPDLITTFLARADLVALNGQVEGRVERNYTLYTTARKVHTRVPRKFLERGLEFYDRDTLWHRRVLWFTSRRINPQEWQPIIYRDTKRRKESIDIAIRVERQGVTHQFQAGLPSLGKNSK